MVEMLSSSHPAVSFRLTGRRKLKSVEVKILGHAQAERMGHIERGRPSFRMVSKGSCG